MRLRGFVRDSLVSDLPSPAQRSLRPLRLALQEQRNRLVPRHTAAPTTL